MKKFVRIESVSQVFPTKKGPFVALRDIDLTVEKGEFVSLIGHSGCGKSTLLDLVAGLTRPSSGVLICDEREITGPGPERAVVFQNHSLLPWLTCFENVYLAVERVFAATQTRDRLNARTREALELVGLSHASSKLPRAISGGMKQRVGIARALAMEPKLLLMDEPFGALDSLTRAHLQDELLKIVAKTRTTTIMVTHDVDEAVLLSDRIVMLGNGPAATIGEILDVNLPRPRDRLELANRSDYLACRAAVVDFLHRRHTNPSSRTDAAAAAATLDLDAALQATTQAASAGTAPATPESAANLSEAPAGRTGTWVAGSDAPEKEVVKVGFIPLADCATVIMASELGIDRRYGIRIEPQKQASWAMVRDGLCSGTLDASHALYSMVYGTHLGIGGGAMPMNILMALNQNGQGITLARALAERGVRDGWALARAVRAGDALTLAHTFSTGTHAMWLSYWLAAHGIDPLRDVDRVVVPPPRTVESLQDGLVHGFCVGEPWCLLAADSGVGFNTIATQSIWAGHPEKVLASTAQWTQTHPNTARALTAALLETARHIDRSSQHDSIAKRMARPDVIGQGAEAISRALAGSTHDGLGNAWQDPHPLSFYGDGLAAYPYESDGMWFLTQLVRWGLLRTPPDYRAVAQSVQRIDLYAEAAALTHTPIPDSPDRSATFFDGKRWDARHIDTYLSGFDIAAREPSRETRDEKA